MGLSSFVDSIFPGVGSFLGGGPDAPAAPDMANLIKLQAEYNRINQSTPFGSLAFSGPNKTQADLTLSPELQKIFEQQTGLSQSLLANALTRAGQLPSENFDPDIPAVGGTEAGALGPFDQSTQAQQATFRSITDLLDHQFQREEERLRQRLSNQGLPAGGEAFGDELGIFNDERNRAYTNAALQSVLAGNQRQNELFGQGLSALGAQQGVRGQNLNEIQSLLGNTVQVPGLQSFYGPSQVDVTGPAGLNYQGQLARYQGDLQQQSNFLGGLSGLGSAAIFALA